MRRSNLKAAPARKIPPGPLTLEAARGLAYNAHCLAAYAIACKRGVDAINPDLNARADEGIFDVNEIREDTKFLAAESSLDALARLAADVLKDVREFRQHDAEGV